MSKGKQENISRNVLIEQCDRILIVVRIPTRRERTYHTSSVINIRSRELPNLCRSQLHVFSTRTRASGTVHDDMPFDTGCEQQRKVWMDEGRVDYRLVAYDTSVKEVVCVDT